MAHVVVIGSGLVGATAAFAILHRGVAGRLTLSDVDEARAEGEAMDLAHALPFLKNARIEARRLADLRAADLVVVCAGRNSVPGETRLDLLRDNALRMRSIAQALRAWPAPPLVLVVSNPVDVLTQVAWEELGRPAGTVLGSGTVLDTARLKSLLGERFGLDPHSIHGYILGEHGDSELAAWSTVAAGGLNVRKWPGFVASEAEALFQKARGAAYEIITRKRATYYAIGAVCAVIAEALLRDQRTILPVSVPSERRYGTEPVCLSLPCVLGRGGVERVIEPELEAAEIAALRRSSSVLARAIR
ncbi:MAG: L-lactate dehydrogenase [Elusimicrobia bacterium]|nr:L-lactate dehydrogenase [Elusimicrobiota bacterium]